VPVLAAGGIAEAAVSRQRWRWGGRRSARHPQRVHRTLGRTRMALRPQRTGCTHAFRLHAGRAMWITRPCPTDRMPPLSN